LQDGAAVHVGHVEVEQDELGALVAEELHRLRAARHADRFFAEVAKDANGDDASVIVVVDHQNRTPHRQRLLTLDPCKRHAIENLGTRLLSPHETPPAA
jgi:hypothetical protein